MRTFLALLIVLTACVGSVSAQPSALAGRWQLAVTGPGGTLRFTMNVVEDGQTRTATLVSPKGEQHPATIALDGTAVTIRWATDDPVPVPIVMSGQLDGDTIAGTAIFGDGLKAEKAGWTASRMNLVGRNTTPHTVPRGGPEIRLQIPIVGYVRDIRTRDTPIVGATVNVTQRVTGRTWTLATDASGHFFVEDASPGLYGIQIAAAGYGPLTVRNFCVVAGKPAMLSTALGRIEAGAEPAPLVPSAGEERVYAPRSVPQSGALTLNEVERAIAVGRNTRTIKPPRLSGVLFLPPSWRIAAMARISDAAGQPFTAAAIPPPFVENMVWVVAGPRSHYENDGGVGPEYLIEVTDIVISKGEGTERQEVRPAWKMFVTNDCEMDMLTSVLGRHFTRPALLAAFPMQALTPGAAVLLTYSGFAGARDMFRGVSVPKKTQRIVVRQKDLEAWK